MALVPNAELNQPLAPPAMGLHSIPQPLYPGTSWPAWGSCCLVQIFPAV